MAITFPLLSGCEIAVRSADDSHKVTGAAGCIADPPTELGDFGPCGADPRSSEAQAFLTLLPSLHFQTENIWSEVGLTTRYKFFYRDRRIKQNTTEPESTIAVNMSQDVVRQSAVQGGLRPMWEVKQGTVVPRWDISDPFLSRERHFLEPDRTVGLLNIRPQFLSTSGVRFTTTCSISQGRELRSDCMLRMNQDDSKRLQKEGYPTHDRREGEAYELFVIEWGWDGSCTVPSEYSRSY